MLPREKLRNRILDCHRCELRDGCRSPVPFSGPIPARLAIVGEGPGYHEDQAGRPFVGRAGDMLNRLLGRVALIPRGEVFACNVVSCRPPQNRDPSPAEVEACRANLMFQLAISKAPIVLLLGRFALEAFYPGAKITKVHGRPWREKNRIFYPTFHPAAALRDVGGAVHNALVNDLDRLGALLMAPALFEILETIPAPPPRARTPVKQPEFASVETLTLGPVGRYSLV